MLLLVPAVVVLIDKCIRYTCLDMKWINCPFISATSVLKHVISFLCAAGLLD